MGTMRGGGTTHISFLQRLREGADSRGWVQFHRCYGELMIRYARRLGASAETAEDAAQEVSLYLFRSLQKFRLGPRRGSFRAYLRLAVVHALARTARQRARQGSLLDPDVLAELASRSDEFDASWQEEEYLHRIRRALRSVEPEFEPTTLEAFRRQVLSGESAVEVAEGLAISRDSVYQAKSRVLRRLRERISELDSDGFPD